MYIHTYIHTYIQLRRAETVTLHLLQLTGNVWTCDAIYMGFVLHGLRPGMKGIRVSDRIIDYRFLTFPAMGR